MRERISPQYKELRAKIRSSECRCTSAAPTTGGQNKYAAAINSKPISRFLRLVEVLDIEPAAVKSPEYCSSVECHVRWDSSAGLRKCEARSSDYGLAPSVASLRRAGADNAGFRTIQRSQFAELFVSWWCGMRERSCIVDWAFGIHVDQGWLDLVPGLFDSVEVVKSSGWNVTHGQTDLPRRLKIAARDV
jgi:hypothetical protein